MNEWMCIYILHISQSVSRRFTILLEWDRTSACKEFEGCFFFLSFPNLSRGFLSGNVNKHIFWFCHQYTTTNGTREPWGIGHQTHCTFFWPISKAAAFWIHILCAPHLVRDIQKVDNIIRLDFCHSLVSGVPSLRRTARRVSGKACPSRKVIIKIKILSTLLMSSDDNHWQAHMTPTARNICTCAVFATTSFNFGPPTYFVSCYCYGRALYVVFYRWVFCTILYNYDQGNDTILFNNKDILVDGKPLFITEWFTKGIHTIQQLFNEHSQYLTFQ